MALHGSYYEAAKKGGLFHLTTAVAGVLVPVTTTVGPTFGLFTPVGSGVDAVLRRFTAGFSATTGAAGNFLYQYKDGMTGPATGAGITALTEAVLGTTLANALLGEGLASKVMPFPATATLAAAGKILRPVGVSELVTTATDATNMYSEIIDEIDGGIIVPPGVIFYIAGNVALLSLFDLGLVWEEVAH